MAKKETEIIKKINKESDEVVVNREELIDIVALKTNRSKVQISLFLDGLEEAIFEILRSVEDFDGKKVKVKPFNGICICAEKIPTEFKTNNLNGERYLRTGYIKPSAKVSRRYKDNLNKGVEYKSRLKQKDNKGRVKFTLSEDERFNIMM